MLVLLTMIIRPYAHTFWMDRLFIALCTIATILLWRKPTFPNRSAGLATSWLGPLLIALWSMFLAILNPLQESASTQVDPSRASIILAFNALILFCFLKGCIGALVMVWLFRGYGLIPWCALTAVAWPHRLHIGRLKTESSAKRMEAAAQKYPQPLWWLPALCFLLMGWLQGIFIAWAVRGF